LSAVPYSLYSQLLSIAGGCPSMHNQRKRHAVLTKDPPHMGRLNIENLSEVEVKEKYHAEVSNKFAALEILDTEVEINSARETINFILSFIE
jgi:hypothetical protein